MLLTTISGPRPVAYASDAATRDARRAPGSVMSGQPAHRASQAPVNVLKGVDMQVATVERDKEGSRLKIASHTLESVDLLKSMRDIGCAQEDQPNPT